MVAGCPKCSARYRVDADRIGSGGAKLRCTKCSAVFLVRAPKAPRREAAEPIQEERVEAPVATSSPPPSSVPDAPPSAPQIDPARLVIVADSDEARGKLSAEAIRSWGLTPHLVHDGVEAMLSIQRMLPAAIVLDAALPKMFGFQICEIVKRNESLQHMQVVLVGAIHDQDRYRRDPSDLYGADVYIEEPDLPEGLKPIFEEAGLPVDDSSGSADVTAGAAPSESAPAPVEEETLEFAPPSPVERAPEPAAPAAAADPILSFEEPVVPPVQEDVDASEFEFELKTPPLAETPAPEAEAAPVGKPDEDPETTEERERALRLARIAVSEMLLYSPDKFEGAVRDGNLEQVLDLEIQEARALLRQRISEEVRAETDFIIDELNRVAADRGGQG